MGIIKPEKGGNWNGNGLEFNGILGKRGFVVQA
jgi:hypothetical protein